MTITYIGLHFHSWPIVLLYNTHQIRDKKSNSQIPYIMFASMQGYPDTPRSLLKLLAFNFRVP